MKASAEASRRRAIADLEKFRERRRASGSGGRKTDLQALRGRSVPWFVLPVFFLVVLVPAYSGWPPAAFLVMMGGFLVAVTAVILHNRRIEAVLRLFEEGAPQGVDELLRRMEEPVPESKRSVVEFMKKFSERRRKFDAYSLFSDLQALRRTGVSAFFPGLFLPALMWRSDAPAWLIGGLAVLGVITLVTEYRQNRRVKAAVGMFEAFMPQSAGEVLERIGEEPAMSAGAPAKRLLS